MQDNFVVQNLVFEDIFLSQRWVKVMEFYAISTIFVLLVEKTGENHRSVANLVTHILQQLLEKH